MVSAACRLVPTNRISPFDAAIAIEELRGAQQAADRLPHVDDVDQVPLAVDVRPHLRVPPARPVPEMDARIDQVFDHKRHDINLFQFPEHFRAATPRTNGARRPLLEAWNGAKTMSDSVYRLPRPASNPGTHEGAGRCPGPPCSSPRDADTCRRTGGSEVGQRWVKMGPAKDSPEDMTPIRPNIQFPPNRNIPCIHPISAYEERPSPCQPEAVGGRPVSRLRRRPSTDG